MEYTYGQVPALIIAGMVFSLIIAVVLPIVLCIVWKVKTKSRMSALFIGCATFVLFALILEQILHTIVLGAAGESLTGNLWAYAIYGGACAALFEETGRFLAMKFVMKKNLNKQNGIMYGIGHGGIEAIIIVGISEISNLATAFAVNSGAIDTILKAIPDESLRAETYESISTLWTSSGDVFFAAGVERISAIALHICLSYLVYKAVSDRKILYLFSAMLVHFLIDAVTVLLNQGLKCNIWILEAVMLISVAVLCYFVVKDYRNRQENISVETPLENV